MYEIKTTGQKFNSYLQAVRAAEAINSEVYEVATGMRRWVALPKINAKRARQYQEQASAYAAQEAMKSR